MSDYIDISIVDTAIRCGIWVNSNSNRVEIPVNCPFCNDKKKHASLNVIKNLFHCNRCGEGHNPVTLYAKIIGIDTKTAYKGLTSGDIRCHCYAPQKQEREPKALAERHSVYNEFLQMLELSNKHKSNLLNRGLDSSTVRKNMYRSVPDKIHADYISEKLSQSHNLLGIPGFYTENGIWRMTLKDGMFIPVRNQSGYIQGLQIRLDNVQEHKYRWFSSRFKENGTRACSWAHISNSNSATNKTVFITEGALKADVASYLSGDCYIGLSGVNCTADIVSLLDSMSIKNVYEALDMDKFTNKHVAVATDRLYRKLISAGINCESYVWDKQYNGVDNYLLFCQYLENIA